MALNLKTKLQNCNSSLKKKQCCDTAEVASSGTGKIEEAQTVLPLGLAKEEMPLSGSSSRLEQVASAPVFVSKASRLENSIGRFHGQIFRLLSGLGAVILVGGAYGGD